MTDTIDLSHVERVGLKAALNGAERAARVLLMHGGDPVPSRPMLWPCAGEALNTLHDESGPLTPDVDLLVAHRVVAGGRGAHLKLDGRMVYADGAYPYYVRHWFEQGVTPQAWAFDAPARIRLDRAFVITHFNYVWGHWLTEMYPKLFLIRALNRAGVVAPLVLPRSAPTYVARIVRELLPDQEIITYDPRDETVEIGAALLPHMLQSAYRFHDFLRWSLEDQALAWPRAGGPDRIFVSRGGLRGVQGFRELENEAEIEGVAQDLGLTVLRPETMPWAEQARIFSQARVVAGEYGSGLHNALLSPEGCQVVSLNWVVEVQSRIANFRRHDLGYILPSDGQARLFTIAPQASQPFTIDPTAFRQKLTLAVDRAEARAAMAGWDDATPGTPELRL